MPVTVPNPPAIDQLQACLAPILRRHPKVRAAYLFGSVAEGRARPDSDIDVGMVCSDALGLERLDLLAELSDAGLERVDLAELRDDDLVLRFEAVRPNRLVYATADFDHGSYFSRTLREYWDLQPYLQRQRDAMKRRLLHGSA